MMINPQNSVPPERARASILERLGPSVSYALVAIAGAVGAIHIQLLFRAMRASENAGPDVVYGGMAEVYSVASVILLLAAGAGFIGIIVAAIRMFTTNRTASPSGFLYLLPAGIGALSPLMTGYAGSLVTSAVRNPSSSGVSGVVGTIDILNWAAIGVSVISLLILAVYTFVPFRSRLGRKFTPVLFLFILEGAVMALAIAFFVELRICWSLARMSY